jgi:hypothetical protein
VIQPANSNHADVPPMNTRVMYAPSQQRQPTPQKSWMHAAARQDVIEEA